MLILAFATVYLVWGSTYFFIQIAVRHFPPMMLGAHRFLLAGILLMGWCLIKGENTGSWKQIQPSIIIDLIFGFIGVVLMFGEKVAGTAFLLGVFLADEHMTLLQISGLVVILVSVLLINLAKYRKRVKGYCLEAARQFHV